MPTYIMLSTLTPEGVQTVKNNPQRIKEVNREIEQIGAKVLAQWATLGRFDFVNVVEAPDEKDDGEGLDGAWIARNRALRVAARDPDRRVHRVALNRHRARTVTVDLAWNPRRKSRPPQTVCYRHPSRETAVSCSNCGRPICTGLHGLHAGRDQVPRVRAAAPVGARAAASRTAPHARSPRPSSAGSRWGSASCCCRAWDCSSR